MAITPAEEVLRRAAGGAVRGMAQRAVIGKIRGGKSRQMSGPTNKKAIRRQELLRRQAEAEAAKQQAFSLGSGPVPLPGGSPGQTYDPGIDVGSSLAENPYWRMSLPGQLPEAWETLKRAGAAVPERGLYGAGQEIFAGGKRMAGDMRDALGDVAFGSEQVTPDVGPALSRAGAAITGAATGVANKVRGIGSAQDVIQQQAQQEAPTVASSLPPAPVAAPQYVPGQGARGVVGDPTGVRVADGTAFSQDPRTGQVRGVASVGQGPESQVPVAGPARAAANLRQARQALLRTPAQSQAQKDFLQRALTQDKLGIRTSEDKQQFAQEEQRVAQQEQARKDRLVEAGADRAAALAAATGQREADANKTAAELAAEVAKGSFGSVDIPTTTAQFRDELTGGGGGEDANNNGIPDSQEKQYNELQDLAKSMGIQEKELLERIRRKYTADSPQYKEAAAAMAAMKKKMQAAQSIA